MAKDKLSLVHGEGTRIGWLCLQCYTLSNLFDEGKYFNEIPREPFCDMECKKCKSHRITGIYLEKEKS